MTNTEIQQPAGPVGTEPAPGDPSPENLDKVRDILFGGQMRAIESRLQGMEARLLRGQETLRADIGRQIAELNERLDAERARRAEELRALGAALEEALKDLERRHVKLEEATGLADADLRDEVLGLGRALGTEIGRVNDRLSAELARTARELGSEKLDTSRIVSALAEMASSLGGEPVTGPARKVAAKG